MWYVLGGAGAFLYVILVITLGLMTLRRGHWVMFFVGFVLPIFWLIGALVPAKPQAA